MNLLKTENVLNPKVEFAIFGAQKIEEEKGFSCVVCYEGYRFQSGDIFGLMPITNLGKLEQAIALLINTLVFQTFSL